MKKILLLLALFLLIGPSAWGWEPKVGQIVNFGIDKPTGGRILGTGIVVNISGNSVTIDNVTYTQGTGNSTIVISKEKVMPALIKKK